MKKAKKICALILSVILVMSILPTSVLASNKSVAKIGDKTFDTLQEAVDYAKTKDDVVTVLEDVTETVTISKGITINLSEHTISGSTESYAFDLNNTNDCITIENGTILGGKSSMDQSPGAIKVNNSVMW